MAKLLADMLDITVSNPEKDLISKSHHDVSSYVKSQTNCCGWLNLVFLSQTSRLVSPLQHDVTHSGHIAIMCKGTTTCMWAKTHAFWNMNFDVVRFCVVLLVANGWLFNAKDWKFVRYWSTIVLLCTTGSRLLATVNPVRRNNTELCLYIVHKIHLAFLRRKLSYSSTTTCIPYLKSILKDTCRRTTVQYTPILGEHHTVLWATVQWSNATVQRWDDTSVMYWSTL